VSAQATRLSKGEEEQKNRNSFRNRNSPRCAPPPDDLVASLRDDDLDDDELDDGGDATLNAHAPASSSAAVPPKIEPPKGVLARFDKGKKKIFFRFFLSLSFQSPLSTPFFNPFSPTSPRSRLRQRFAATFDLGLLSSSSASAGVPDVLMRVDNRPLRSCLRGARKKDDARPSACGPLRFGATATVYFFNNEEEVSLLVQTRSDLVVGRRIRLLSEVVAPAPASSSSVSTSDQADAASPPSSSSSSLTSSDTTMPPRRPIPRRAAVDPRAPPPPIFLTGPLPSLPAAAPDDDDNVTAALPLPSPGGGVNAVKVSTPRPVSVPSPDASDDSDSPPPITKKSHAIDVAGGLRSPRALAAAADVAASAPSRFADTSDWLATTPTGATSASVGLAKHREDGSLASPRSAALSPRTAAAAAAKGQVLSEIDAVLAVVDDHEARRQQQQQQK
jgi:hypothetical protein